MRELAVDGALEPRALAAALSSSAPLLLDLVAPPREVGRLELLSALLRFDGVLVARFGGVLAPPLAEAALLAPLADWREGARLDLSDALLAPLVCRVGRSRAVALLLAHGPVLDAGAVLTRLPPGERSRSALALATARDLLWVPPSGRRVPLARERAAFAWLLGAGEKAEGLKAFRERRPPSFGW